MRNLIITLICLLLSASVQANQINTVLTQDTTFGQVEVKLPVIDGSADEDVETAANTLLLKAAKDVARAVGNNGSVSYEVTLNRPSLLSVLLKGDNGKTMAYEAVNIDMTNGREFGLHEFYMDNDATKAEFGQAKSVLFTEKGVCKQFKKEGPYQDQLTYRELLPVMRIGEAGRLVKIARLTDKAEGKTVTLERCGLVAFKLASDPNTGYNWNLGRSPLYKDKVVQVGSSFIIPGYKSDKTAMEQGPMEIMMIAMMEPGTYDVKLEYRRPWDRTASKSKNFKVVVKAE